MKFFDKMKGSSKSPPRVNFSEIAWSWIGGFLGIFAVAFVEASFVQGSDLVLVIASFGSSAVLLYGATRSPLAQPRNFIGGHVLSAFVGVASFKLFPDQTCLAASLAVATAIAVMHATRTLHPPAGATALTAVIGGEKIHTLGFLFPIMPTLVGAVIMLVVALLVNNIPRTRRYPEFWV